MTGTSSWPLEIGTKTTRALDRDLRRFFLRGTASENAAHDLTQEVWLSGRLYRQQAPARQYLFAVAKRQLANWFRFKYRRERVFDDGADVLPAMDPATTVRTLLERASDRESLRAALEAVPEPFKRSMELALTGMTTIEISEALGLNPNTVRSRLSRGRTILRRALGHPADES